MKLKTMKKKKNEKVNINGSLMGAEDGEVKRPLSEELLKSGYMSVEEDRTNVHADIDNYHLLKRVGGCTRPSFNQRNCRRAGICNIVILSSESKFRPANPKYKNKTSHSLSQCLKWGNYVAAPVTGRIGSEQHLCAVINISLESIIFLCEQYNRKSFVYTEFIGDGRTWSDFFEIRDVDKPYWRQSNPYVVKETCERQDAAADTNELFAVTGTQFEYSLPVSTLEHINQVICDNMDKFNRNLISRNAPPHTYGSIQHILCGVGYSSFYYKRTIYKGLLDCGIQA